MCCHIFVLITALHRRSIETFFTLLYFIDLLLCLLTVNFVAKIGVCGVEARIESEFEKCCGLGTSWAAEGRKCKNLRRRTLGVPQVEKRLCLETADICCVRAYHEKSCEKGKENARAGLACVHRGTPENLPGNQQRDCCKACTLGKS